MKRISIFLSILLLNACATMQTGLQTYVRSETYTPGPIQVVLDCTISTFYDDSGTQRTGFSENYNNEVCEAFADEVRAFAKTEKIGEVLEPVTITLGGQYGRNVSTAKIFIDDRDGRLDGVIKLPKSQGKTIPFNTLPQANLPHLIKELSEGERYGSLMGSVKYNHMSLGGQFYSEVKALPVTTNFPLVEGSPILLININGQKLTDSLQSKATRNSVIQGVGTALITGLLTGGNYIASSRQKMGSVVAVNAVLIDEAGEIVWTRISGGELRRDLSATARSIFYYIRRDVAGTASET